MMEPEASRKAAGVIACKSCTCTRTMPCCPDISLLKHLGDV